MNPDKIELSVVLPIFNESENIEACYQSLAKVLEDLKMTYEILIIDDGSADDSFAKIEVLAKRDSHVRGIALSRNFGHQIALSAGMDFARGDILITMDADLQHPPELIPELLKKYRAGYDIVSTVRLDDQGRTFLKKTTSAWFYKTINLFSETWIEPTGDFRLMSRKAVDAFKKFPERARFIRGLTSWMGFKQTSVTYQELKRRAGDSKYTASKMLALALDGLTSFSAKPLRASLYLGLLVSFIAFLYMIYALTVFLFGKTVPGWTSILLTVLFLGGIQLITIGILGEYLGRIFQEVKNRPLYLVAQDTAERPNGL
ncbi:MAG: glycosyltransferase family 2 protein [Candidatus Omnitrophica bacterium]|nr:glycosyltransferase family 2 protein [Candidatus Omnitrophota bacterium]